MQHKLEYESQQTNIFNILKTFYKNKDVKFDAKLELYF